MTGAPILADGRVLVTLVDIMLAGRAVETRWASTDIAGLKGQALPTIGTGIGCTRVSLLACLT